MITITLHLDMTLTPALALRSRPDKIYTLSAIKTFTMVSDRQRERERESYIVRRRERERGGGGGGEVGRGSHTNDPEL